MQNSVVKMSRTELLLIFPLHILFVLQGVDDNKERNALLHSVNDSHPPPGYGTLSWKESSTSLRASPPSPSSRPAQARKLFNF